jgi:hypothetical protein
VRIKNADQTDAAVYAENAKKDLNVQSSINAFLFLTGASPLRLFHHAEDANAKTACAKKILCAVFYHGMLTASYSVITAKIHAFALNVLMLQQAVQHL